MGDVRRILRSVEKKRSPGKRDYAIILLLATYGLGAAEVLALRLEDLDWKNLVFRTHRPKTKASIELPLLPAVARALTDYLRGERPPAKGSARLFLRKNMPYEPITSGAIRHRIHHWAKVAGIPAKVLGAHIFRHSHATRQVDAGANIKVVSDILGHRSVSSTSVYVRVALKRLRGVGLAVPRSIESSRVRSRGICMGSSSSNGASDSGTRGLSSRYESLTGFSLPARTNACPWIGPCSNGYRANPVGSL